MSNSVRIVDSVDENSIVDVENNSSKDSERDNDVEIAPIKRTRRGIASRIPLSASRPIEEANIYSSRISCFREKRKKLPDTGVLLKKFAEERELKTQVECAKIDELDHNSTPEEEYGGEKSEVLFIEEVENSPLFLTPPPKLSHRCRIPVGESELLLRTLEDRANRYKTTLMMEKTCSSFNPDVEIIPDEQERKFNLKIHCRSEIKIISTTRKEHFKTILPKLAEMFGVSRNRLLLSFGDVIIKSDDTPASLGLRITDIIDCGIMSEESSREVLDDKDLLHFKLQAKDMKKKIVLTMQKTDTILTLMEKYAKERGVSVKKLTLSFDGESLDPECTAEDLDLEDDYCIDVIIQS